MLLLWKIIEQGTTKISCSWSCASCHSGSSERVSYLQWGMCESRGYHGPSTTNPYSTRLYWITDKIFVSNISTLKDRLINDLQDNACHLDYERTYWAVLRTFFWPNMRKDVKSFVSFCSKFQRIKPCTDEPYGLFMPLHFPIRPWDSVSMDCITNLLNFDGYGAILTVVCHLSNSDHHCIPCNSALSSRQLANSILDNVYRLHGLPRFFICDLDKRYTS